MRPPGAPDFQRLQAGLADALAANVVGSHTPHVLIALPSFSVGESLLAHYAPRIPALEHRYLLSMLTLGRIETCELVFISCQDPGPDIIEYYFSLLPPALQASARRRLRLLVVPDHTPRPIAEKLLDRPDLIAGIRSSFAGRPAFIEPWNVTQHEVDVALALGAPINGTAPELWPLGYKSAGRRLFAEAGVPVPFGFEDARTVDDLVADIAKIRQACPTATGVVIKHDNSGAGDGNAVIGLRAHNGEGSGDVVRHRVEALPPWYLHDIALGTVVEELISGSDFASPSVQVELGPTGDVQVLSTHDQVMDQATGQVYTGCRFPANAGYAAEIGHYGNAVGEALAKRGAIGRFGVDFAAARTPDGRWRVCALEINLRKGGTTHPFTTLRQLVPGQYEVHTGRWVSADGTTRAYHATDNLVEPSWLGLRPAEVIQALDDRGLRFDRASGTGVVLHMVSCLAIDGRFGLTAIGRTAEQADDLVEAVREAVSSCVQEHRVPVMAVSSRSAPLPA